MNGKTCATQTGIGWISQVKGTNCKNHLIIICSQQLIVFSNCIKQLIDLSQELYRCYALQGNAFQEESTDEYLKLDFKFGFQHVLEHQKSLGKTQFPHLFTQR